VGGWWGWVVIGIVWLGAFTGIALSAWTTPHVPRLGFALYLVLGWAGIAAVPALSRHPGRLAMVVTAGVLYTVGAILFSRRRPTLRPAWFGYHEFWHGIGVAAGALFFVVNLSLIASRTT
jgi:hemolysin III